MKSAALVLLFWSATALAQSPLSATLIAPRSIRFDPRLASPATIDRLHALEHPTTRAFDPDAQPTPLDAMIAAAQAGATTPPAHSSPAVARYQLDYERRCRAAEDAYRRAFGEAPRSFPIDPPAANLILRVHNSSAQPIDIRVDGDTTVWRMRLSGPGAIHVLGGGDPTYVFVVGTAATVPAHGDLDIPIRALRYGDRANWLAAYWTAPGRYTLDVELRTSRADDRGDAITLRPAPIRLEVR